MNGKHIDLILIDDVCITCQRPMNHQYTTCENCGKPVHLKSPECGYWLFDGWQAPPDENIFYCTVCMYMRGIEV